MEIYMTFKVGKMVQVVMLMVWMRMTDSFFD